MGRAVAETINHVLDSLIMLNTSGYIMRVYQATL